MWWCHGCGRGGDVFEFVLTTGHAESFIDAVEFVESLSGNLPPRRERPKFSRPPEDPERLVRVRSEHGLAECNAYLERRGLARLDDVMHGGFEFRVKGDEYVLRVLTVDDDEKTWWQDRVISEAGSRWRSPAGHPLQLFVWTPSYFVRRKVRSEVHRSGFENRTVSVAPDPLPLRLVVEGGTDFLTAVAAQADLPLERRFAVLGLPGTASVSLLDGLSNLALMFDNDDAGRVRQGTGRRRPSPVGASSAWRCQRLVVVDRPLR